MSTGVLPRLFDPDADLIDGPALRSVDMPGIHGMPGGMAPSPVQDTGSLEYLQYFVLWD